MKEHVSPGDQEVMSLKLRCQETEDAASSETRRAPSCRFHLFPAPTGKPPHDVRRTGTGADTSEACRMEALEDQGWVALHQFCLQTVDFLLEMTEEGLVSALGLLPAPPLSCVYSS